MKNRRIQFAVVSVLFLIILAIAPLKDFTREWKSYQNRYNDLVAKLPQRVKPAEIGIKQIWIKDLDKVDRCETCHLGVKEPALASAPQPFRSHPRIYHDVEEFGCTQCHGGQGAATTTEEAHGKGEFWDKPLLKAKYMEAACAKCHQGPTVPQAPILTLGRSLIEKYNCVSCHKLDGYEKQWVPPLDAIGTKVNRNWLVAWLKNPKAYFGKTRMPNFNLSVNDVNLLADFLLQMKAPEGGAKLDSLPAALNSLTDVQKAKFNELGTTKLGEARCISCHPFNGKGGTTATDLGKIASKVNAPWLYTYVKDPQHVMPGVGMPRFRFTEQDLEAVVTFMRSEYVDYDMQEAPPHDVDPDYYEKGLALFKKLDCSGCHQLGSLNHAENLGPDLTEIGSKKPYEIDYGPSKIERTLADYIQTKLLTPRAFSVNARMPNFGFTPEEAQAITVALLSNSSDQLPEKYVVRAKPKSTFVPQGEFGRLVKDLACMTCHKMNGAGGNVAPDLTLEASQARAEWIDGYFKIPYSLRPILTERMPNFYLSDKERKTLVDGIENLFVADSLDRTVSMSDSVVQRGRGLYFERYACQACHQISGKGGYVGPPLDKVGARLTSGWTYHWLKEPQTFKPESIEPNNNLSESDIEALTAYLMTLK